MRFTLICTDVRACTCVWAYMCRSVCTHYAVGPNALKAPRCRLRVLGKPQLITSFICSLSSGLTSGTSAISNCSGDTSGNAPTLDDPVFRLQRRRVRRLGRHASQVRKHRRSLSCRFARTHSILLASVTLQMARQEDYIYFHRPPLRGVGVLDLYFYTRRMVPAARSSSKIFRNWTRISTQ